MDVPLDNLPEWKDQAYRRLRATMDRRSFLRGGLNALTGAALLGAMGKIFGGASASAAEVDNSHAVKTGTFFFPRLKFDVTGVCEWNVYPFADVNLRQALAKMTNVNVSQEPVVVSLADFNGLRHYPFVFATDQKHFSFPKNEEDNLREFLLRGGFVFGDDCVLSDAQPDLFFQDFRKMMNRIYPDNPMRRVPDDHELYHCYFDFPNGLPYIQGAKHGAWATFDKESDRILTIVTPTDLHCGWTCQYFSPDLNEQAIKMGINIIMFYLTH